MPRPRKPTHLKIMDGDRSDRVNRDEPLPDDASLIPPWKLSDRARAIWDRLAPRMKEKGIFTDWDVDSFAQACDSLALYEELRELLEVHRHSSGLGDYVAKGAAGGLIPHPYFKMMRDAQAMAMQIYSRFGMTPADRSKLSVKGEDGAVSGLDELIS